MIALRIRLVKNNHGFIKQFFIFFVNLFFILFSFAANGQNIDRDTTTDEPAALFEQKKGFDLFRGISGDHKKQPSQKTIQLSEQRFRLVEKNRNTKGIAVSANHLGLIWLRKQDYVKSLNYFLKALDACKQLNDKKEIAIAAGEIGYVYQQLKDFEKALQYYYNSYELSKEQGLQKINISVAGLMGMVYLQKKDTLLANKFLHESLDGLTRINDKKAKSDLLNRMGELYLEKNDFTHSVQSFNQSLLLKEELKDTDGSAIALRNLGLVYFKKGDYEKALEYFNKSIKVSNQPLVKKLVKDAYLKLAAVYSFRKEFDKADTYHNRYRELKESLYKEDLSKSNSPEKMESELEEKEKVIELLSRENEEQTKILNQQGLELSQQLTATELERQGKEKALEDLSLATLEKKEKETQLLLVSKENAEKELELSKNELELSKKTVLTNLLIASSLVILLILFFTYNRYRYKKKSNEGLSKANTELKQTLEKLKSTQDQLVHSQKMASLGQLTAGIAHEIQNPLNFVNNFSDLSVELLTDLIQARTDEERKDLVKDLKQNLTKISHHGKRADNIVKSMLQHSRTGIQEKESTDINKLAEEFIHLTYHGMRASDADFNCSIEKNLDPALPKINVVPQDISRVLINILNNAFYTVKEKRIREKGTYKPVVSLTTQFINSSIIIKINDNGNGIPGEIKDKIFNPFFSTKPTGEGTGIGLSLSYDIIVHGHGGTLKAESKDNAGATFIIELPV